MEPYQFIGIVLPERARLSISFNLNFSGPAAGYNGAVEVSIINNQIMIRLYSEANWEVHDLRNIVLNAVQSEIATVGYLIGHVYEVEIIRVVNKSKGIDYVFGIDIPCINEPRRDRDVESDLNSLRSLKEGKTGIHVVRCFNDLNSAMRHADDTAFYCFRAIEALRHHCAATQGIADKDRKTQWECLKDTCGFGEGEVDINSICDASTKVRHGEIIQQSDEDRVKLLQDTWTIVDKYVSLLLTP